MEEEKEEHKKALINIKNLIEENTVLKDKNFSLNKNNTILIQKMKNFDVEIEKNEKNENELKKMQKKLDKLKKECDEKEQNINKLKDKLKERKENEEEIIGIK